jgi:hypothetical protein
VIAADYARKRGEPVLALMLCAVALAGCASMYSAAEGARVVRRSER